MSSLQVSFKSQQGGLTSRDNAAISAGAQHAFSNSSLGSMMKVEGSWQEAVCLPSPRTVDFLAAGAVGATVRGKGDPEIDVPPVDMLHVSD